MPAGRPRRGPLGLPLILVATAGALSAGYLSVARLAGEAAVCGPSKGCEAVAASEYAVMLGVPVAYLGLAFSLLIAGLVAAWWLNGERRALTAAYLLLLLGTLFVAYLTYLELFVIEAICPWCVAYAVTIVIALATAGLAMARTAATVPGRTP